MQFKVNKRKLLVELERARQNFDNALVDMKLASTSWEFRQASARREEQELYLVDLLGYARLVDEDGTISGYTLFDEAKKTPQTGALSAFLSAMEWGTDDESGEDIQDDAEQ